VLSSDRLIVLGDPLGRGSISTVQRGMLESAHGLRRPVAVKIFDSVASDEREELVSAVVGTARKAAMVHHPNVVDVYDVAVLKSGQPVMVTELVEGRSLTALLDGYARADRKLPPDLAFFVALEIAEGLGGARDTRTPEGPYLDLCHTELSGRDVLVSWNGEVKLTDFGMAQAMRPASAIRSVRSLSLRAVTLSPEAACGQTPDARSDVFALGILLHEMLVGPRWPLETDDSVAFQYARDGYVHVGVFEPQLFEPIAAVLKRALAVDPNHRYPHAGVLAYDLRRAVLSMGVGDGRIFLRQAMHDVFTRAANDDGTQPDVPSFSDTAEAASYRP
jgi:serine/threonine protein kinase